MYPTTSSDELSEKLFSPDVYQAARRRGPREHLGYFGSSGDLVLWLSWPIIRAWRGLGGKALCLTGVKVKAGKIYSLLSDQLLTSAGGGGG